MVCSTEEIICVVLVLFCLTLRRLGHADKYQGNLSELVRESLKNFVENNPDILVTNDIAFLLTQK